MSWTIWRVQTKLTLCALGFYRWVRLEFHGSKISSDAGWLMFWELDEVLDHYDIAGRLLKDTQTDLNQLHSLVGLLLESIIGRLAGYEDVDDAERLSLDPAMRQAVGGRAFNPRLHPQAKWDDSRPRFWPKPIIVLHWWSQAHNMKGVVPLIGEVSFGALMADKAFNTNWLLEELDPRGATAVIPPKTNRKHQRDYEADAYKWRHLVENYFAKIGLPPSSGPT